MLQNSNDKDSASNTSQKQSIDVPSFLQFLTVISRGSTENTILVIVFMGLIGFFGSAMFCLSLAMHRPLRACPSNNRDFPISTISLLSDLEP